MQALDGQKLYSVPLGTEPFERTHNSGWLSLAYKGIFFVVLRYFLPINGTLIPRSSPRPAQLIRR